MNDAPDNDLADSPKAGLQIFKEEIA